LRGEVLGAWVPIFVIQVVMTILALIAYSMSGAPPVSDLSGEWVYAIAAASLLVLPGIALASIALQNAMVILFPAWVALGTTRSRGFEASGQRILMLFGTLFVMTLIALPAAASGGAATWLLYAALGPMSLLIGGAIAGAWMVVETWVGCWFLGGVLDRIDPST